MLKEVYKEIVRGFQRRAIPELKPRKIILPVSSGKIISAIGPRRSGKTFTLLQTAKNLLANGTSIENIIFINFEDERLGRDAEQLDFILQACRELNPEVPLGECHFFFDEIQNITGWEKFVRRLYDTESKNIGIMDKKEAVFKMFSSSGQKEADYFIRFCYINTL